MLLLAIVLVAPIVLVFLLVQVTLLRACSSLHARGPTSCFSISSCLILLAEVMYVEKVRSPEEVGQSVWASLSGEISLLFAEVGRLLGSEGRPSLSR